MIALVTITFLGSGAAMLPEENSGGDRGVRPHETAAPASAAATTLPSHGIQVTSGLDIGVRRNSGVASGAAARSSALAPDAAVRADSLRPPNQYATSTLSEASPTRKDGVSGAVSSSERTIEAGSGSRTGRVDVGTSVPQSGNKPSARSEAMCAHARRGVRWYSRWVGFWRGKMGAGTSLAEGRIEAKAACPRYLAKVLRAKAYAARKQFERWQERHYMLRDFAVYPDSHAWRKAVREVQRVFPGTESWLLSCSAAEGGHGRWVTYGGGSDVYWALRNYVVGGWMQFKWPTFNGMYRHAYEHARGRGYRLHRLPAPGEVRGWLSPTSQALAAGWARYTGNDASHWSASFGNGC